MMLVILLGQIDLSVPGVAVGGMMSSAATAMASGEALAIPLDWSAHRLGFINGIGVAYLRIRR